MATQTGQKLLNIPLILADPNFVPKLEYYSMAKETLLQDCADRVGFLVWAIFNYGLI